MDSTSGISHQISEMLKPIIGVSLPNNPYFIYYMLAIIFSVMLMIGIIVYYCCVYRPSHLKHIDCANSKTADELKAAGLGEVVAVDPEVDGNKGEIGGVPTFTGDTINPVNEPMLESHQNLPGNGVARMQGGGYGGCNLNLCYPAGMMMPSKCCCQCCRCCNQGQGHHREVKANNPEKGDNDKSEPIYVVAEGKYKNDKPQHVQFQDYNPQHVQNQDQNCPQYIYTDQNRPQHIYNDVSMSPLVYKNDGHICCCERSRALSLSEYRNRYC